MFQGQRFIHRRSYFRREFCACEKAQSMLEKIQVYSGVGTTAVGMTVAVSTCFNSIQMTSPIVLKQ